jgi:AraC family transcriptional regulator
MLWSWSILHVLNFAELRWAQKDGRPPQTFGTERPPGESGVAALRTRFDRAAYFSALSQQHLIFFQISPRLRTECRIGGRLLFHETDAGSLAICPAGVDCSAETDASIDTLLIAVKPSQLALAAAEDAALDARLNDCMSGSDPELLALARLLTSESASGYKNGPLYWSEAATRFLGRLVSGHTSLADNPARGKLGYRALQKIRDHILANLAEPIEVGDLAALAGRSEFHFSRVFARSVGMTPHRYVVHLRLQAARAHIRAGRMSLAEIAADTGFSDQSHLSRWIRRVHGVAPSELS